MSTFAELPAIKVGPIVAVLVLQGALTTRVEHQHRDQHHLRGNRRAHLDFHDLLLATVEDGLQAIVSAFLHSVERWR